MSPRLPGSARQEGLLLSVRLLLMCRGVVWVSFNKEAKGATSPLELWGWLSRHLSKPATALGSVQQDVGTPVLLSYGQRLKAWEQARGAELEALTCTVTTAVSPHVHPHLTGEQLCSASVYPSCLPLMMRGGPGASFLGCQSARTRKG